MIRLLPTEKDDPELLPDEDHEDTERRGYRDTGCDLHPACLSCPLPKCRYDGAGYHQPDPIGAPNSWRWGHDHQYVAKRGGDIKRNQAAAQMLGYTALSKGAPVLLPPGDHLVQCLKCPEWCMVRNAP